MGSYMNQSLFTYLYPGAFVFDLEYVGHSTDLNDCYIWEIGIIHLQTCRQFNITVDPGIRPLPKPCSADFEPLTEEKLTDAVPFHLAWTCMLNWINSCVKHNTPLLWIAHNCFKADKVMFEVETKRHKMSIPLNWYFFDTLIYCRIMIPKLPSYTLSDVYYTLMNKPIDSAHEALSDAISLSMILRKIGLDRMSGPIYPVHSTSLQVVKWLGPSCEKFLFTNNIYSLEHLITYLRSEYSKQILSGVHYKLRDFVVLKLNNLGIKEGNSISIADSLIQKWIL